MAEAYTGPVTLFTVYSDPELRGKDGELIAAFMPHRLPEAKRLAACWNACNGITTNELEHIASTGGMLGPREDVARIASQRDELVDALRALHRVCMAMDLEADHERPTEDAYLQATAQAAQAIAKAAGQEGGAA